MAVSFLARSWVPWNAFVPFYALDVLVRTSVGGMRLDVLGLESTTYLGDNGLDHPRVI